MKVKPHDKDAKMKYQECNKIVKQKAFERAIAGDEHKRSVVDSLDIESMSESGLGGPPPPARDAPHPCVGLSVPCAHRGGGGGGGIRWPLVPVQIQGLGCPFWETWASPSCCPSAAPQQ